MPSIENTTTPAEGYMRGLRGLALEFAKPMAPVTMFSAADVAQRAFAIAEKFISTEAHFAQVAFAEHIAEHIAPEFISGVVESTVGQTTITFSKDALVAAYTAWQTDYRNGFCIPQEEDDKRPIEDVAASMAKALIEYLLDPTAKPAPEAAAPAA